MKFLGIERVSIQIPIDGIVIIIGPLGNTEHATVQYGILVDFLRAVLQGELLCLLVDTFLKGLPLTTGKDKEKDG